MRSRGDDHRRHRDPRGRQPIAAASGWDPGQYERYADHRTRPALDLIARIPDGSPAEIWDLGCGTGTITRLLAERWPGAAIHGLDDSPEMLDRARGIEGIDWVAGAIEDWAPEGPVDLVFSNAALQWVADHDSLLPRLTGYLAPGGVLAVQMPRNHGEPSHTILAETARSDRWKRAIGGVSRSVPVAKPGDYWHMIRGLVSDVDIWETIYLQVLEGEDPVAAWTRATGARPYLAAAGDDAEAFFADYTARLRAAYPMQVDGTTLFPFRRLFIVARR